MTAPPGFAATTGPGQFTTTGMTILHPEKGYHRFRMELVSRQVRHRDVNVAPMREKKVKGRRTFCRLLFSDAISQDADFDQNDQEKEKEKEDEQKGRVRGK